MASVVQSASPYAKAFAARRKERRGEPVWAIERRIAAMSAFKAQGLPSRKVEAWRNLDLTPLRERPLETIALSGDADALAATLQHDLPEVWRLVFVDGYLHEGHSDLAGLPEGLSVHTIRRSHAAEIGLLEAHLGRYAPVRDQPFAALNTAFFGDGALIHCAAGLRVTRPIVLSFLSSAETDGVMIHPRVLIVAEPGAELSVMEVYRGAPADYLNCPVTECTLGANASLRLQRSIEEGAGALHLGAIGARVERGARLSVHALAAGGRVARADLHVELAGPGADVALNGLYLTREGEYADFHSTVTHTAEHGTSRQLFKGVLQGRSEAVYDGLVRVAKGAQKSDARQENRNLLLSKRALAHSNPRLEIHADDVKCSHGSSIGELDAEALMYLRSRGIGPQEAQGLLALAFIGEVLAHIEDESLRHYARRAALARLPGDWAVEEVA